jgi:hypothetical protein
MYGEKDRALGSEGKYITGPSVAAIVDNDDF